MFGYFSHDRGERDFLWLSGPAHRGVFRFLVRVEPDRDQSGHVGRIAQEFAAALNECMPAPFPRLAGHRGEACKAGDLFAPERADLRALDQDHRGGDLADTQDGHRISWARAR